MTWFAGDFLNNRRFGVHRPKVGRLMLLVVARVWDRVVTQGFYDSRLALSKDRKRRPLEYVRKQNTNQRLYQRLNLPQKKRMTTPAPSKP